MNTQSNAYTVIYSTIMVVAVAAVLTLVAVGLKPAQKINMDNEKRSNILKAAGVDAKGNVEAAYNEHVKDAFVVDANGAKTNDDAFNTTASYKDNVKLPVFVVDNNGTNYYVLPLSGAGLWDKIWGYAALQPDFNTIAGVVFDHKGETPGLGAEMVNDFFREQFKGREMYENGQFSELKVYKGDPKKNDCQDKKHGIDAISGSTMTTNGVQAMVNDCLKAYAPFKATLGGAAPADCCAQKAEEPCCAEHADSTECCSDSTNVTK